MSAASAPSLRATSTTSYSPARPAITWVMRGSRPRAICSMRSSSLTLAVASSEASGSDGRYRSRPDMPVSDVATWILRRPPPAAAIALVALAAWRIASGERSSE